MLQFRDATFSELLAPGGHACACGKHHVTGLRDLRVGSGVLAELPDVLEQAGKRVPFVVCDADTYRAAGERVMALLNKAGVAARLFVFPERAGKMEPDEAAVGALAMAFDPMCDVVLAVGSGVVNDCCKVLAHAARLPSMVVCTAPSMDGYASNSASMIQNGVKVTIYNACPVAIVADTDILCEAPMHMLHAGLGDMLAKYISVCEWRMAHLVTGEYYCENVAGLMRRAVGDCLAAGDGLVRREGAAVEAVLRGLVLSGVAMSYAEVSRPASGLEHYFSHLWEMMALSRGEASDLHGLQVGVGSALTFRLLDRVRALTPDPENAERFMREFSPTAWEAEMREIFGPAAQAVIDLEYAQFHKNDPSRHAARLERLIPHWPDILAIMAEELPDTAEILSLMRRLGMPMQPADLGISLEDTKKAFIGSREIRDKYLTSSVLWDLGELHAFAAGVGEE